MAPRRAPAPHRSVARWIGDMGNIESGSEGPLSAVDSLKHRLQALEDTVRSIEVGDPFLVTPACRQRRSKKIRYYHRWTCGPHSEEIV